jgi:hypothetical protein
VLGTSLVLVLSPRLIFALCKADIKLSIGISI